MSERAIPSRAAVIVSALEDLDDAAQRGDVDGREAAARHIVERLKHAGYEIMSRDALADVVRITANAIREARDG